MNKVKVIQPRTMSGERKGEIINKQLDTDCEPGYTVFLYGGIYEVLE